MARRERPRPRWRRWLGPADSWRRVVLTGVAAGVTLAFVAALVMGLVGGGGGGSLNDKKPTPAVPAAGPVDTGPVETEAPTEQPVVETPTEEAPVEVPTEAPTEVPTEVSAEPTPTPPEEPPPEPTVAEGG